MTSQAPSSSSVKPNFLESLFRRSQILIGIFILWTVSLVAYTIISQQSCNPILWWQQGKQTECWITSVHPERLEITLGEQATLTAQIRNIGSNTPKFGWSSSNSKVAIEKQGDQAHVVARSVGTTEVQVKFDIQENQSKGNNLPAYSIPVEVLPKLAVNPQQLRIKAGETRKLEVKIEGLTWLTDKSLSWKIKNHSLLEIDSSNQVKALKPGKTEITGVWNKDKRLTQTIPVEILENPPQITAIQLVDKPEQLYVGTQGTVKVNVECQGNCTPADLTVSWSSEDVTIASISGQGQLLALNPGTTKIVGISNLDPNKSTAFELKVSEPIITGLHLEPREKKLGINDTFQFQVKLEGEGDFKKELSWESDDPEIVEMKQDGVITGQKKGTAHISVKSITDSSKTDTASVEVTRLCSRETAVIVGGITTVGVTVLTVPPPFAVGIGSAAAWGYCWFVENVN
jgi:uncharacterized protein YjdB